MILGSVDDLYQPDAVLMDEAGFRYLWPGRPLEEAIGKTFEMNDRRAVVVGLCKCSPTFQTFPILYTRYSQAIQYIPAERKVMSFVLAQPKPGLEAKEVCRRIMERTDLQARTQEEFMWKTIGYYMSRTGIPINFGITVMLGFIVGAAIAGQTFYLFTMENLKQFGALKAMGVSNWRIVGMSLLQALVVGATGYGLGVCGAALFDVTMAATAKTVPPAFFMTWHILVGAGVAVLVIVLLASLISIRKVLVLEPAIVFKG
jgi:putative ABC transport system permease protein